MLQGTRCIVRPFSESDAAALASGINHLEVVRWMTHQIPFPYALADARAWIAFASEEQPTNNFAIEVSGELAGGIGLRPFTGELAGGAEIGYWIAPAFWNRGIATDATQTLAAFALARRGLRRLVATVFAPNVASVRVLERSGFRLEGESREQFVDRTGAVYDGLIYARLASNVAPAR